MNSGTFAVVPKGTVLSAARLDRCELEAYEEPTVEAELRALLPHVTQERFVLKWQYAALVVWRVPAAASRVCGIRRLRCSRVPRSRWAAGDLVVWDNRATLHCATGFDEERYAREMWRTTIVRDRV